MDFHYLISYVSTCIIVLKIMISSGIFIFFNYKYKYWPKRGIPTITPQFIYGSFKRMLKMEITFGEQLAEWYKIGKEKEYRYIGIYNIFEPVLVPMDLKLIKNILLKDFDCFSDRVGYCNEKDEPLTGHLFCLEGIKWKNVRNKLSPVFSSSKLKFMFQSIVNCSEELRNCLDKFVTNSEAVDVKKIATFYATDVIGSCIYGIDCNSFKNPDNNLIKISKKYLCPSVLDRIRLLFTISFPTLSKIFGVRHINKDVEYFFKMLVTDVTTFRQNHAVTKNDLIQIMMQLKNKETIDEELVNFGINEIAAQAFGFYLGGYDTSSSTIAFCLFELAQNSCIQEIVREEIIDVLKKYNGQITYEAIMDMQYLENVVLETLRKYPPLSFLLRRATKKYLLPDKSTVLEKGIAVYIPILGLHYDPEYFPEPNKFDPDRFLEKNKIKRSEFSFLPFGEGPKKCIGLRFGMLQIKIALCCLLCNYRFSPNPKTCEPLIMDPKYLMSNVKNGVWLNVDKI